MLLSQFRSQLLSLVGPYVGLVVWTGKPGKDLVACGSGRGLGRVGQGGLGGRSSPSLGRTWSLVDPGVGSVMWTCCFVGQGVRWSVKTRGFVDPRRPRPACLAGLGGGQDGLGGGQDGLGGGQDGLGGGQDGLGG